jgi:carboxyl-terminal processing protease
MDKRGILMSTLTKAVWIAILVAFFFGVGLLGGVAIDRVVIAQAFPMPIANTGQNQQNSFPLLDEAYKLINQYYVDRPAVQQQALQYGAISGMVDSLGDTGHSRFMTPQMVKEEQNMTQGQFEGIGAEVETKNNQTVIVAPIDGSPAQKAGLGAGDIILKVNGQDVQGQPISTVVSKILGPAGTKVTLTIQHHDSGKIEDITLTRARIQLQNVTWAPIPGTNFADLRLAAFSNNISQDLVKALQDIQKQGYKGIILDLRDNPGGLLDESVNATSQFLSSGVVLEVKDAKGNVTNINVKKGGIATSLPMVVLINEGTASAAEIMSGAIQDAGRAKLVGDTTFGTGTVLNQFPLSDGSALLLATEEWLTPKGRVIWHQGIKPDIAVTLPTDATPILPSRIKSMNASDLQSSKDTQFLKGLDILNTGG